MKSDHENRTVGKWIGTIFRYFQMYIAHSLRDQGIGTGQLQFLILLYQRDGVPQYELSDKLFMDRASATRAIQVLEKRGYVVREPYSFDRRKNLVYLTDKAEEIKGDISNALEKWTDILTQNMSQEEEDIFMMLLRKAHNNAVAHVEYKSNIKE